MNETIKAMIDAMETSGAGFASVTLGNYTIIITDDKDGADYLSNAWDEYVKITDETARKTILKMLAETM